MNKNLLSYHNNNRYYEIFKTEGLQGKMKHVEAVIKTVNAIADFQHAAVDKSLLSILAEHHDDGRVDQYRLLGKFLDTEVSHNILGVDRMEKFVTHNNLKVDAEMYLLQNVMMYHGRQHLAPFLTEKERLYVDIVTAADDFENACSCVSYLIKEVENDEKGYTAANPEVDQKHLTKESADYVWKCFKEGNKFDKNKICKTYADYVMFAATLATMNIIKYADIARMAFMQPGYGYSSILEGFKVTFEETLTPADAERAYTILNGMLN